MPIVIDEFDIQPAPPATAPASGAERKADTAAPSEQQLQAELARLLVARGDRRARLRVY
jgi:hypothetical protein